MEPSQGAGEKRISESHKEARWPDSINVFGTEPQSLHEQNLDKTIDDEVAAWSVGERLLDDRIYRALKPSRSGIGGLDMDKGWQQTAEQAAVDGVQFEITTELLKLRFKIEIAVPDLAGLTSQRLLPVKRNDFACEVACDREGPAGWHKDEIAYGETHGFMPVDGQPAFAGQHKSKARVSHSRTTHGPTSGPLDNLRSDRARAQQGNHIGERFHIPDDL
jgi:hypothetical protein